VAIAVSLLSGGLDSTVATLAAAAECRIALAITVDYGQRAAEREITASERLCRRFDWRHEVVPARWLARESGGALLVGGADLPAPSAEDLSGAAAERSASAVWVPNRNGLFVAIAAARAEAVGAEEIVVGFNAEESVTFPDNSAEYVAACDRALSYSTRTAVRVRAPLLAMDKVHVVREGARLGVDFDELWPCYEGGAEICGRCESCRRFARALEAAGLDGGSAPRAGHPSGPRAGEESR